MRQIQPGERSLGEGILLWFSGQESWWGNGLQDVQQELVCLLLRIVGRLARISYRPMEYSPRGVQLP
jgi:hypothetical protein